MRTLRFIVDGRDIKQDPSCSFNGLFPGTEDTIKAEFAFSSEWKSVVKVIAFWSLMDKEYPPQVLNYDENACMIPKEALARPAFKIQILGKQNGRSFKTNMFTVYQRGGKT